MYLPSLVALLGLTPYVSAHYFFPILVVNKTNTPEWKYVRDVAKEAGFEDQIDDWQKGRPQYNISDPDIVCGRQAWKAAGSTQTADVVAGETVGLALSTEIGKTRENWYIFHNGPAQAYLSRAPDDDLSTFTGIGADWFKIAFIGAAPDTYPNPNYWITFRKTSINITIPALTPPGKYLLRVEHIMATEYEGWTGEFYVNCAQINVIGPGGGVFKPEHFAKFPGAYTKEDPKLLELRRDANHDPLSYKAGPGPAVWEG